MKRAYLLLLLSLALVFTTLGAENSKLRAGAATSNITPPLGSLIVGGFRPFPATHIHDELHARCMVLESGEARVAFVVCDLLGAHTAVFDEARRLVGAETKVPASNVFISCTHTHSAGSALGQDRFSTAPELDEYQRFVARRIADGVRRAENQLAPAQIGWSTGSEPREVFNRRWFMKEGTVPVNPFGRIDKVKMNPGAGNPNLTEPAGPIDPTISFIALREPGDDSERGAAAIFIDPRAGTVLRQIDRASRTGGDAFLAYQRPLHEGDPLGLIGRIVIAIIGLLPAMFVVTGTIMWLAPRRRRRAAKALSKA